MTSVGTLTAPRCGAVVVMSDLVVLARQHRLLAEIRERDLTLLVVVGPDTRMDQLRAHMANPNHPLAHIQELKQVPDASVDTVLSAVQDWVRNYVIKASLCCGEVFVDPAGVLAEALALPGPGSWAARVCRDKIMQRTILDAYSPRWRAIAPHERVTAQAQSYPAVLKPAGRMYSSGVRRVECADELKTALDSYCPAESALIEEFIHGPEFSVEALVHDGTIVWSGITAKSTNENDSRYFTEIGHVSPAQGLAPGDEIELLRTNSEILAALRIGYGITHAEFRLSEGRAVLMEVAARLPGDAITMLWHLATGQPLEPAIVDLALGVKPSYPAPTRRAQQYFVNHPHGRLKDVTFAADVPVSWPQLSGQWPAVVPTAPDDASRAVAVLVAREPGAVLAEQRDSGDRSVSVVGDFPLDMDPVTVAKSWCDALELSLE
jgi:hypothetical protein